MNKYINIAFVVFLLLRMSWLTGQEISHDISFRNYTTEDGLSSYTIRDIEQDTTGFVWIATNDGLNRFDGYDFKVFKTSGLKGSLPDNSLTDLFVDSRGILWIATSGLGLVKYDNQKETFSIVRALLQDSTNSLVNRINKISEDSKGNLWLASDLRGVVMFNPVSGTIKNYTPGSYNNKPGVNAGVTTLSVDEKDRVWFGTYEAGLFILDTHADKFTNYIRLDNSAGAIDDHFILTIRNQADNVTLVSSNTGVYKYVEGKLSFEKLNGYHSVFDLLTLTNNKLYITTMTGFYELANGKPIKEYKPDKTVANSISSADVRCIFEDRNGTVWLGTDNGGVNTFSIKTKPFETYRSVGEKIYGLSQNIIRSFTEDGDGNIWVATLGQGIDVLSKDDGKFYNLIERGFNGIKFDNNSVTNLYADSQNNIWIGTWGQGVYILKNGARKPVHINNVVTGKNNLINSIVLSVFEDDHGNIWFGTEQGVDIYYPKSNVLKHFYVPRDMNVYNASYSVQSNCIVQDIYRNIWIGTFGGLHHFEIDFTNEAEYIITGHRVYKANYESSDSLQDSRIVSLEYATYLGANSLYVGTYGSGLHIASFVNKPDQRTSFEHVTTAKGLSNNVIYTIESDKNTNLWLGTGFGLSKYNLKSKNVENYYEQDGIQGNQFFWGASFKTSNGKVLFGGLNGFTLFNPDQIYKEENTAPAVITQLWVNGLPIDINDTLNLSVHIKPIVFADKICLSHNEDALSFKFSALAYNYPEFNTFKYMLEGVDDGFKFVNANNRLVTYANIPPGNYTFRLKAANHEGVWNPEERILEIEIKPPFWDTLGFKLAIVLALVCLVYVIIMWRISNFKKQKEVLGLRVEEQTSELREKYAELEMQKEQLSESRGKVIEQAGLLLIQKEELAKTVVELNKTNATKDKFFSIIAHDLKNPIGSIASVIDLLVSRFGEMGQEKMYSLLKGVLASSKELNDLLNNLLAWASSQSNRIQVFPQVLKATTIIEKNVSLVRGLVDNKKIELTCKIVEGATIYADFDTVNTALRNILSNAIKFTPAGGAILIEVKKVDNYCKIEIQDSGVGISNERLGVIFEVDKTESNKGTEGETGTGLGLILSKEFVEKNNGQLEIESELGKGTRVIVTLPISVDK